jgi:hypothetical protein
MPVRPPDLRRIDFSSGYQYYTFWSPATAQRSRGHIDSARCSWCLATTKHLLVEQHKLRRNVYECASCARRTVPCRGKGCGALGKGGLWDSEKCVVCSKDIAAWPLSAEELAEQRAATDAEVAGRRRLMEEARDRAEAELRKRPAMLRVAMSPADFRYSEDAGYASSTASSEDGGGESSGSSSESEDEPGGESPPPPRVHVVFRGEGRLGFSFSRDSTPPFTIAKIAPLTLAAQEPRLRVGMALVAVQGDDIAGLEYDVVLGRLRDASRPLSMAFVHTWLSV